MTREVCPHCGDLLLDPVGPISANILVVGDYPDWVDVMNNHPFYARDRKLRAGDILHRELERVSINPARVRYTNLWRHTQKKVGECEIGFHITHFLRELMRVDFALLAGSAPVRAIMGDEASAQNWNGLELVSEELPKNVRAMAMVKVATGFDMLGEVRFAIERFGGMVHGS